MGRGNNVALTGADYYWTSIAESVIMGFSLHEVGSAGI